MPDLQGLNSMTEASNGEATPSQNTVPKINPLTFDEAALAKLLQQRFSEPVKSDKVEEQELAATSVEEPVAEESASETAENGEETTVDEAPEQETAPQQETDDDSSGVQKRINKLVAQKKEAAAKAEALERELADAQKKLEELQQAPPVAPVALDNPFSDVWDEAKLSDEWRKARDLRRWCEDNADGCEVSGKEYSAEDIKAIRRKVEDALDVHIPGRHQFLNTYKQVKPVAEASYPWWKDRSNPTYSEAQQVLRQMPQLASYPDYQIAIGDFLEGRKMRMERDKSAKAPKAAVKVAPKQPSAPKASPVRTDKSASEANAAKRQFLKTGSSIELAKLLQSTLLK